MEATEDEKILSLYENRDETAIAETNRCYGALCYAAANNILESREDAEECVSDAFLSAWNAIPPAKPLNLRAYLLRLVRNHAFNRWNAGRSQKRGGGQFTETLDELAECIASGENVERDFDRRVVLDAVVRFLEKLPLQQRHLFVRRYWYAAPISELASDFGMTENHVYVTLSRVRSRMQKALRKEGLL